jgi:hypothetical protein
MARYIIHHEGVFNIYSTVVDAPLFTCGLSERHVIQQMVQMNAGSGQEQVYKMVERAMKHGTSEPGSTLRQTIACNRAGPHEAEVPFDEFLKQYLTIREVE